MPIKPKLENKRWDFSLEQQIFDYWEEKGIYEFDAGTDKPIWSIDTPPPYASGKWHLGGAIHYSQIDIIARVARMRGYAVNFPMGIDRNGLPIEVQVEKEFNISMWETPRDEFIKKCKTLLDKYDSQILEICRRLGFSCNSLEQDRVYRTDSPEYRAITQATFIELWKKGLISEENRPNNYCTVCGTTIADAEIEYRDIPSAYNYLKFRVKETGESLEIATTRPELLCACAAVLVHPEDNRYKHLFGKTAIVPLYDTEVPIIPHTEANPEQGSGVVMICSYGDYTDVRLFRELRLKPISAINPDGTMTEAAGKYSGMKVEDARKAIVEDLKREGYLIKREEFVHSTPICWRSKNGIEFIAMPEYYLNQIDFLGDIEKIANDIEFHPKKHKHLLVDWINSVTVNWPISRRRYYGTELPLWYCKKCGNVVVPPPGKYYQPWRDDPPVEKCEKCGSSEFRGEERTFDTWMDSSISALYVTGYMRDNKLFEKAFPCTIRPQGKDIVRTWLYYTLLRVYQLTKKPAFKHVWISGHVVDSKGKKMSKSLGNAVWPEDLIEKYGADALRFWGCIEASVGSDIRFSEEHLKGASKFIQKVYNISRFISIFDIVEDPDICYLQPMDRWILGCLNSLIKECDTGYGKLDFIVPASRIRSFMWNIFADIYLEAVKKRAYNENNLFTERESNAAKYTLHTCLKSLLKLLAPISPFVTEYIWQQLYSKSSIHLERFPKPHPSGDEMLINLTDGLCSINSFVWKMKKKTGRTLRSEVSELYIPEEYYIFKKDLAAMHSVSSLKAGEPRNPESYHCYKENDIICYLKF